MIILRHRLFSGYAETQTHGTSYHPAQVVLDPLEKSVDWVDKTELGKVESVKKKTKLVKNLTSSLRILLRDKERKNKLNKNNK